MGAILYIEDDKIAAMIFCTVVNEANIRTQVDCVSDGDKALEYLHQTGEYAATELPNIIFLDLNLPQIDGWQVLVEIKHEKRLRSIPVVILSTSCRPVDKQRAYDLGASRYISKPYRLADFVTEVGSAYGELVGHST